jgi:hypothetical protein
MAWYLVKHRHNFTFFSPGLSFELCLRIAAVGAATRFHLHGIVRVALDFTDVISLAAELECLVKGRAVRA